MKVTSITYRILSLTMALMIFISSIGITVDLHYCQGKLKTFSFIGKAKSCHDIGEGMKNCPHHKKMMEAKKSSDNGINKKDCCSNKTHHFQSEIDQQLQLYTVEINSLQIQYFVIAFFESFLSSSNLESEKPSYANYKPPLIPMDIYVLLETYLI